MLIRLVVMFSMLENIMWKQLNFFNQLIFILVTARKKKRQQFFVEEKKKK